MKKLLFILVSYLLFVNTSVFAAGSAANVIPTGTGLPSDGTSSGEVIGKVGGNIIQTFIQYIAIFAVISVMLSGMMYLISGGEEDKVKNAKKWIIWSLIGVFFSVAGYTIVGFINQINF